MLIKGYMHYLLNILSVSWLSVAGLLSIACLIVGLGLFLFGTKGQSLRRLGPPVAIALSLVLFTVSIYTSVYTIEQTETYADIAKEFPDDADCGTAWTEWSAIGMGLSNPCGKACYRGATLGQEMKMAQFPPWPMNRRQIQCWVRKPRPDVAAAIVAE